MVAGGVIFTITCKDGMSDRQQGLGMRMINMRTRAFFFRYAWHSLSFWAVRWSSQSVFTEFERGVFGVDGVAAVAIVMLSSLCFGSRI